MRIDIWSDVVCPFCYVGRVNLEVALEQAGIEGEIYEKAFRLQPGSAPEPVADMLARKYGLTGVNADAQQRRIESMAANSGLDIHLDGTWIGDTLDAHRVIKMAGQIGQGGVVLERLFRAYFTEKRDVLSREGLVELGVETGLDRAGIEAMLASDAFSAEVLADQTLAEQLNVRGVPFFVIDQKLAISGAQPVEAFLNALKQVAPVGGAAACAPGG